MIFVLTIDTEADNQWDHGRELTTENIRFVPPFQELCNKFDIPPTYLVTSEVCENPVARRIFTDFVNAGRAEIGAHLHSWTTPPFIDKDGFRFNDPNHAFATELPLHLLNEKLKNLTGQIETSFGKRPLSFRSGRFGFNTSVATALIENSYLVDSSITPYVNWKTNKGISGGSGGPDFSDKNPFPFSYNSGNNSLIEIPVTIIPTKYPLNRISEIAKLYFRNIEQSLIARIFQKIFFKYQPLWLRPLEWMNINLFKELIDEAGRLELPYLVMMFHSSELMPGCSIYRKDEESVKKLYAQLDGLFRLLEERNIKSMTLTGAAKNFNS